MLEGALELLCSFIAPDFELLEGYLNAVGRLEGFDASDPQRALTLALKPDDADYARVFRGAAAEQARAGYASVWADAWLRIEPRREQVEVVVHVALAEELGVDPGALEAFPGGYRDVAPHLMPGLFWAAWEFREPGQPCGLQHNGLVLIDNRFAWFPKPWRVITG